MTEDQVIMLGTDALKTTVMIAGPLLLAALVVGVIISTLQAITQINEATLTFIPKMIAIILVIVISAPWMMEVLTQYAASIFGDPTLWVR